MRCWTLPVEMRIQSMSSLWDVRVRTPIERWSVSRESSGCFLHPGLGIGTSQDPVKHRSGTELTVLG